MAQLNRINSYVSLEDSKQIFKKTFTYKHKFILIYIIHSCIKRNWSKVPPLPL